MVTHKSVNAIDNTHKMLLMSIFAGTQMVSLAEGVDGARGQELGRITATTLRPGCNEL